MGEHSIVPETLSEGIMAFVIEPGAMGMPMLWALICYLIGSIPFGMILSGVFGLGDLRRIGSGNIGATNVFRTGNKSAAAATLILDGGKGAFAVALTYLLWRDTLLMQIAGLAAMIGHCYPVWLGFRGGKGVASFLGVMLAWSFPVGLLCCLSWLAAAFVTRISSVGALMAALSAPLWMSLLGRFDLIETAFVLGLLIYWRHRANISRLLTGTEPRIGRG